MSTLRTSKLAAAIAATLLASACSKSAEAPLPEATGRMRAAPVDVMSSADGGRHVSVVVAPATPTGPLTLLGVTVDGNKIAPENVRAHRASTSLVVLVDDSAEMGDRGLTPAANGLLQAVAHAVAPHSDRIGAMAFNDEVAKRFDYASPQSLVRRKGLRLDPHGARCLNLGLQSAIELAAAAPLASRSVLVATSGDDAGGACPGPERGELIARAKEAGIAVSVAHLGPSETESSEGLQALASETGGQFWVLGTTDSLDALANQIASGLASHLFLSIDLPPMDRAVPLEVRAGSEDAVLSASMDLAADDTVATHNDDLSAPIAAAAALAAAKGSSSGAPADPDAGSQTGPVASTGGGPAAPGSGDSQTLPGADSAVAPAIGAVAPAVGAVAPASSGAGALTGTMAVAGIAVAVGLLYMRRRRARKARETHSSIAALKANVEAEKRAAEEARNAEAVRAAELAREEEMAQAREAAILEEAVIAAAAAQAAEEARVVEEARARADAEAAEIARAREEARVEQIARAEEERAAEIARKKDLVADDEVARAEARAAAEAEKSVRAEEEARQDAERAAAAAAAAAASSAALSQNGSARAAPVAAGATAARSQAFGAPPRQENAPFALVGSVCGRYRLEAPLGRGGLGEVYRARDLQFDRIVAVKVLFDDMFGAADAFDSLMREVSLVDRITHPNVVRVYDVIRFEGRVAIVMEYVHGQSLSAITREQGAISPEDFDPVLAGVAEALDAAHAAGVVHGDVTPGNVLITEDGKVKLCDFGVGRLVGDDPSAPRAGTPRFVAPEVVEGSDAGPHSDVYSLGALTLHVLAGRNADLTALAPPYRRALEGALEPDPDMRCASAGALGVAFHHAVEEDLLRRRSPVRRLVDSLRLRTKREPEVIDLPPTVTFPRLISPRLTAQDYEDPDRTQPLPQPGEPGEYTVPITPDVTQPMGPRR